MRVNRFIYVAVFAVAAMQSCPALAETKIKEGESPEPAETSLERGPYLQLVTPQSIVIVWRTTGKSLPQVRFGTSTTELSQTVSAQAIITRAAPHIKSSFPKLHSAPDWTYQFEAKLTGLTADTTYYYAVYDGEKRLAGGDENHRFKTHPVPGAPKPVRMWVVGDSGTGGTAQAAVTKAMIDWTEKEKRPIDMYIHVGDMAYKAGKDFEFTKGFYKPYEAVLRNVVCWPSMGNHEGATSRAAKGTGPYYDSYVCPTKGEAGGVPSGSEAYYSFDYGDIHFICLSSHELDRSPSGTMYKWLNADLEKAKAAWLVAFWHHPPYSKGSHDSDKSKQEREMRTHFMPVLESAGVDLVLTGHSHIYERSMLMDGAYATPTVAANVILDDGDGDPKGDGAYRKSPGLNPNEGDVQVVAGHGGAGLGRLGTMPVMKKVIVENGSCIVEINGDTLTSYMINKNGELRDTFSIVKSAKVTPQRIANPRQLPVFIPKKTAKKKVEDDDDDEDADAKKKD
jgi:acid phosphatase type 7